MNECSVEFLALFSPAAWLQANNRVSAECWEPLRTFRLFTETIKRRPDPD
jgi:hypothetical protein